MALNKVPYVDGVTVITAENLNDIQDAIIALENAPAQGLTEDMKQALLQLARKLAYIDDQGQTYYDDLYDAFYPPKTVVLITAVFEQGSTVIYDDTALDDLKQYLTVTAKYDDNTTAILADSAYTLSGLLEAGTSTVTVAYNGLTTTFTVNVTARPTLSSITAVYTPGQDTPKTIDPTRISAYIGTEGAWTSYNDSYSVCVPVTVGKQYNLHFSTTDSSLVGTIFRYGFSNTNTPTGQSLSGFARSTPQDLSNATETATGQYLVIQLSAATAPSAISNGYLTLTELARIVYDTDTLDSLKANLVVTAVYSDSSTATVAADAYTLSGELTEGTQTITVSYGGKTTTFNVTVVVNGWLYHFNQSLLSSGSEDFGFTGVQNYAESYEPDNLAYYHKVETPGTSSTDVYAIKAVSIAKLPDLSGDFTFSFWWKNGRTDGGFFGNGMIANKRLAAGSATTTRFSSATIIKSGWSVTQTGANGNLGMFRLTWQNTGLVMRFLNINRSKGSEYIFAPPTGFINYEWRHYAITRKNGVIRLFVDGEVIATIQNSESLYFPDQIALGGNFDENTVDSSNLIQTSYGNYFDDFFAAEYCKWDSNFDPTAITY